MQKSFYVDYKEERSAEAEAGIGLCGQWFCSVFKMFCLHRDIDITQLLLEESRWFRGPNARGKLNFKNQTDH